jgi:aminoglycoside phosphotransferase (APT) family kinase protein
VREFIALPHERDPVSEILASNGIHDPWQPLLCTGVANRIYATRDVVLRIATDHPEAVSDARTESVAAPVARAAGLPVPALITFDDSRSIVDRPYTIWERIHGETLGLHRPDPSTVPATWREVGRQLARLHSAVDRCDDPNGWLDAPEPPAFGELQALAESAAPHLGAHAREVAGWIDELRGQIATAPLRRFLHNDVHPMNLMCRADASLLAVIDWGDAGWGDPALDFAEAPVRAIPFMLDGYRAEAAEPLGDAPEARIVIQYLWRALADLRHQAAQTRDFGELRDFITTHRHTWR